MTNTRIADRCPSVEGLKKHVCQSCDISDDEWERRDIYNKAVADVLTLFDPAQEKPLASEQEGNRA